MDTTARPKIIAFSGAEFAEFNGFEEDPGDVIRCEALFAAKCIADERGYYKVLNIRSSEIDTEIARGHYPTNDFEWVGSDEALDFADEVARRVFG